ncbi:uncharacterized protein LOC144303802 isoform X1 [Canis aureus]
MTARVSEGPGEGSTQSRAPSRLQRTDRTEIWQDEQKNGSFFKQEPSLHNLQQQLKRFQDCVGRTEACGMAMGQSCLTNSVKMTKVEIRAKSKDKRRSGSILRNPG